VSTKRIATKNLKVPISLKMAVKGFRSTINYQMKPVIQISSKSGKITEILVSSLENYDIILGMPYLNHHQVVIDCEKVTIMLPKTRYVLQYQRGIQVLLSVAVRPENTLNFFQEFSEVFLPQKPSILSLLQYVNHTITLLDTKIDSNPQIFIVSEKYISKYEEAITN
jgi:hypothetical protein